MAERLSRKLPGFESNSRPKNIYPNKMLKVFPLSHVGHVANDL